MSNKEHRDDDEAFARSLLESLDHDVPAPHPGIVRRTLQRTRVELLLRDVVDFVSMRFFHRSPPPAPAAGTSTRTHEDQRALAPDTHPLYLSRGSFLDRTGDMTESTAPDIDRSLVEKAQVELPYGTSAYNQLVEKYSPQVYRRAYRILRSPLDAEEATQDVFLSVFRSLRRYRFDKPFVHWLNTITLNACRMILRKRAGEQRRRDAVREQSAPAAQPPEPDAVLRNLLHELLDSLDPGMRVAVLMRFVEGNSFPEIAEALEISESAAKMRVSRGAKRLRELYEERSNAKPSGGPHGRDVK